MANAQPTPNGRSRCNRHGLVVSSDGACPSCARKTGGKAGAKPDGKADSKADSKADRKTGGESSAGVARVAAVLVAVAAILVGVRWRMIRQQVDATSLGGGPSAGVADGRVRLAPRSDTEGAATHAVSVKSVPSFTPPPVDLQTVAEDLHLGQAVVPSPNLAAAPPGPPRASIDDEAQPADDPRDFELPAR